MFDLDFELDNEQIVDVAKIQADSTLYIKKGSVELLKEILAATAEESLEVKVAAIEAILA